MRSTLLSGLLVSLVATSAAARAETVRLAIVVGNNAGELTVDPLSFAEADATKVARVLTDLGNVAQNDLYLLLGRSSVAVQGAFDRIKERVGTVHAKPGSKVLLVFYYSGHSDGESLELGNDRLTYAALREELAATGADVKVAIVDSCRSGALLAAKSGSLKAAFEIRLANDLPTSGTVVLTSSAANEDALESRELRGSYFTHNLVSGLRGAADVSGDGRITLSEAYRYAYARTVAATSRMIAGPQHPEYDMRLSGMGEIVLTELVRPSAILDLPAGFDVALVAEPFRDEVLAEVPAGAPTRLALPPGDYLLRVWRAGKLFTGRSVVRADSTTKVAWSDLLPTAAGADVAEKGGIQSALAIAGLAEAVAVFQRFQDEKAAEMLHDLLHRGPPSASIAAKAHIYLGLIALNAVHTDDARSEFLKAMEANATVELPPNSAPKAGIVLAEARKEREQELTQGPPFPVPAVATTPPLEV